MPSVRGLDTKWSFLLPSIVTIGGLCANQTAVDTAASHVVQDLSVSVLFNTKSFKSAPQWLLIIDDGPCGHYNYPLPQRQPSNHITYLFPAFPFLLTWENPCLKFLLILCSQ